MPADMEREIIKPPKIALCRRCGGTGRVGEDQCRQCYGWGRVTVSCRMTVDIRPFKPHTPPPEEMNQ